MTFQNIFLTLSWNAEIVCEQVAPTLEGHHLSGVFMGGGNQANAALQEAEQVLCVNSRGASVPITSH